MRVKHSGRFIPVVDSGEAMPCKWMQETEQGTAFIEPGETAAASFLMTYFSQEAEACDSGE